MLRKNAPLLGAYIPGIYLIFKNYDIILPFNIDLLLVVQIFLLLDYWFCQKTGLL
jgi:hypothetical protein